MRFLWWVGLKISRPSSSRVKAIVTVQLSHGAKKGGGPQPL
ncbi:MAG: hypothetical protein OXC57_02230 [Rhodobacteraceae bacterium]|nr:hypothetical protein [Paracoccaceae bacterium]